MKKFRKENVANANIGNTIFSVPEESSWNSFSKPIRKIDKYPRSKKILGKLNPVVQEMKMQ